MSEEVEENVPIFFSFSNLGVEINDRQILQNVSGKVHPGEMLAVMGPSGSGKTTLLNVLAGRLSPDDGEILLNGTKLNKKLKKKICYVLQEDIFFANLTLRETLTFSAMLRLPDTLSKAQKLQKVEEIVDNLDVRKCMETKIGSPFERGLSGGEKKRANIGCELITNPSLIFLDEPTSGLDSSNALNLVTTLKNFAAREKKTVVTTIHQPSSQIFYMFDKVLLLSGGQIAYYGKASRVLDFFESIGLICDAHFNPADFILEKVTEGEKIQEMIVKGWDERRKRHQKYSTMSTLHEPPKLETVSPPAVNKGGEDTQHIQDMESKPSSSSSNSSVKSVDDDIEIAVDNTECNNEQPITTEEPPQKEEDASVYPTCSPDVAEGNTGVPENEVDEETFKSNSKSSEELSKVVIQNEVEDIPRRDSGTELLPPEKPKTENENETPNGHVPSNAHEISLDVSGANESSAPLIPNARPSPSKTLWRNVRNSFIGKSSDPLPPVHTEAHLSSADFSVAAVTYKRSTSRDYCHVDIHDHDDDDKDHSSHYIDISTSWATSFWTQFTVLLQRTFKQSKPEILSKLAFTQHILLALIAGLIWFQLPYKEESIEDRYALVFFCVVYWNFTTLFSSLVSFPNERTVVNKERAAGYYRLSAYYLAKLCSELPLVIFLPTVFVTIVYWLAGLNKSVAFLGMLFVVLLTALTGQSVGLCIGATVMDFKKSIVVAAVYGLSCMLLGGFYQKHIPLWLTWFQYAAVITYSYDAVLSIEFSNSPTFSCREVDSSYAGCRNNGTAITGTEILERLNVARTAGENIAILVLFIIIFRVATYLSLRYVHKPK